MIFIICKIYLNKAERIKCLKIFLKIMSVKKKKKERDTAWSQECNMDFRYADTSFLMPGTLAPLGLCSARAQLLLSSFWAPAIEWFKLVLWQLVNTWPFLFGFPWSFFLYQTSQTARNFPPEKINRSLLWAPQTLRTRLFF